MDEKALIDPTKVLSVVGEPLVASLLRLVRLGDMPKVYDVGAEDWIPLTKLLPNSSRRCHYEARLDPWRGRAFDGMHKVDVVVATDASKALGVEVKTGLVFAPTHVRGWSAPKVTTHKTPRWRGAVPLWLARYGDASDSQLSVTVTSGTLPLRREWVLVARDAAVAKLRAQRATLEERLSGAYLLSFEDLRDAVGRDVVLRELKRLLPSHHSVAGYEDE